jgi:hypothetical protein
VERVSARDPGMSSPEASGCTEPRQLSVSAFLFSFAFRLVTYTASLEVFVISVKYSSDEKVSRILYG